MYKRQLLSFDPEIAGLEDDPVNPGISDLNNQEAKEIKPRRSEDYDADINQQISDISQQISDVNQEIREVNEGISGDNPDNPKLEETGGSVEVRIFFLGPITVRIFLLGPITDASKCIV